MAGKRDWLDRGLEILTEHGAPGLTIDRLATALGLTKGSFYHHFGSLAGFRAALLDHFETEFTTRFIDAAAAAESPRARLARLAELVATDTRPDPERAIRAWATQNAEVREVQARIDRTRIGYLRSVCGEIVADPEEASQAAQLLYLTLIGAQHAIPPVAGEELHRLYEFTLRRVTGDVTGDAAVAAPAVGR